MANRGPTIAASRGAKGTAGPWTASKRTNAPTTSEVRRAKQQAVGGRRKRCLKGKNCSAACIQAEMVCLVEFPEAVQKPLGRVRDYLMEKNNIQPGSIQERRIDAALSKMADVVKVEGEGRVSPTTGLAKPEVSWQRDAKRAERNAVSWKEVQNLKKRRDLLSEAEVRQEAMRALHKDATTRGLRLPRAELEMIYDVLPKNVQNSLAKSGRPGDEWYSGKDAEGNNIFSKSGGKERALAVLDMWFRQGGTDAYQSRGSKVWAPADLSVEHVIPLSKGGKDVPSNWVLIRTGANTARQGKKLGEWIDKLPRTQDEYKEYLSTRLREKRRAQARKARLSAIDPKQISDRDLFGRGGKALAEVFRGENGGSTPSIFTKEWLGVGSTSSRKGNAGPPAPFAKALGLIAKTEGLAAARSASLALRKTWNEDWKTRGQVSKQDAFKDMVSQMERKLTKVQFNTLFLPAANSWAQANGFL